MGADRESLFSSASSASGGVPAPATVADPVDHGGCHPVETEAEQLQRHVEILNKQLFAALAVIDAADEIRKEVGYVGEGANRCMRVVGLSAWTEYDRLRAES